MVAAAAGPLPDARVRAHRLDLAAFPAVRRALHARRPLPLEAHDHSGDGGDPYDGLLDLPAGHSCVVVPLFTGATTLGIVTLDRTSCGVYPDDAVDHVRGAFSGADRDRPGRFRTADGGTLLLDEIGDMPLSAQARLLRVLQGGAFEPVGSDEPVRVDVRVIAATHVDLAQAVRDGRFREDLYDRLAVSPLQLPPLRDRSDDVHSIAEMTLTELSTRPGRGPWTLTRNAAVALRAQAWPGNVRQLRNTLERATILHPSGALDAAALGLDTLPAIAPRGPTAADPTFPTYRESERRYLAAALARTEGRIHGVAGAAQLVDRRPTTLQSKLRRAGLKAPRPDAP